MMGGAQDTQQEVVAEDLIKKKKNILGVNRERHSRIIYCGGFQYLGQYYQTADGHS